MKAIVLRKAEPDIDVLRAAVWEVLQMAQTTTIRAVRVGFLLCEQKAAMTHGNFQAWIEANLSEVTYRTVSRWMDLARAVVLAASVDLDKLGIDGSRLLTDSPDTLGKPAQEARQFLLDVVGDKSMADIMRRVAVEGDSASGITRAHNGKTKGGSRGEDRKDFPKFIGVKLSDCSTHLKAWKKFTSGQVETIEGHYKHHLSKMPTALLEYLIKQGKEILTSR